MTEHDARRLSEAAYIKAAREAFEAPPRPRRPPRWRLRRPFVVRVSRLGPPGRHPDVIQLAPGPVERLRSITVEVAGWRIVISAQSPVYRA